MLTRLTGSRANGSPARTGGGEPCAERLVRLARMLDVRSAAALVEEELGPLLAHDRHHGTDLVLVLELALDLPSHSAAARAAYMHRNTFRKHLQRALDLVAADIDRPEERLALHLALKLRPMVSRAEAGSAKGVCSLHRSA